MMAKVMAKWVGQVSLEWEWDENEVATNNGGMQRLLNTYRKEIEMILREASIAHNVTVTQLHADIHRDDEPGEWTKEEAP